MLYTHNQTSKYSAFQYLRTKMLLWILIFLLPILIILCVSVNQIFSSYSNQMTINYSQSLRQFTTDIDSDLAAAKRILYSENVSPDFLHLELGSGLSVLESMQRFGAHLTNVLTIQERLDAFFLYHQEEVFFVQNYNTSYAENKRMADALTHFILQNQESPFCPSGEYQSIKAGDNYYLYLGFHIDEGVFGCWFSARHLLENICSPDIQGIVDIFLVLPDGTVLSSAYDFIDDDDLEEAFSHYFVTSQQLLAAPFSLTVLWDRDIIYQTLYRIFTICA